METFIVTKVSNCFFYCRPYYFTGGGQREYNEISRASKSSLPRRHMDRMLCVHLKENPYAFVTLQVNELPVFAAHIIWNESLTKKTAAGDLLFLPYP